LGEFIETFASAETMLFNCLILCANLNHATARVLFSGIHVNQIVDMIRKVWEVITPHPDVQKKLDDPADGPETLSALSQFTVINKKRNSMVHYVSFLTSDQGRVSSNITRAATKKRLREFRVSPDILKDMSTDLEKISDHLQYAISVIADPGASRDELAHGLPALAASWRYKEPEVQQPSRRKRERRRRN
jgi:hypothetical protein